jgi:hypothetical protein
MVTESFREELMFKALGGSTRARQVASYVLLGALRPHMTSEEIEDLLGSIERIEGSDIAAAARILIREAAHTERAA